MRSLLALALPGYAQETDPDTREAIIEQEQQAKAAALKPYEPSTPERWFQRAHDLLMSRDLHWHPFFGVAYPGGGFLLGAGYMQHVSPYNFNDRLAEMDLKVDLSVPDKLSDEAGGQMAVSLKVRSLEDFAPHRVVEQVDALRKLREVREALEQLKTAFLNEKDFRKRLNDLIQDADKVESILGEIKKP